MLKTTSAAVATLACALAFAQEPAAPKADTPRVNGEFTGKVVGVFCRNSAHDAFLEEPAIRQLGRRDYLVGKAAALSDGQALPAGTRIWVALDEIDEIIEFKSRDDARNSFRPRGGG
jgi:hypothetical protein